MTPVLSISHNHILYRVPKLAYSLTDIIVLQYTEAKLLYLLLCLKFSSEAVRFLLLYWKTTGKNEMTQCRNNGEKADVWERLTNALNLKFGTR
jgi:hypothetical protein